MTGKQLKIGCIILKPNGEPEQIAEIKMTAVRFVGDTKFTKLSLCKPVALSDGILERCGFEYLAYRYKWQKANFCFQLHDPDNDGDGYKLLTFSNVMPELKYLHELQILYTALTGEELKLS